MKILIKSAQILDPSSSWYKKKKNILIKDGVITSIGEKNYRADKVIERSGIKISIGWFDMRANFCDPGFEHKEDLDSGRRAAAAGGFTEVAVLPNTNPVVDSKNEVGYIKSGNISNLVQVYPIGAITKNTDGEDLTEMIDLHHAGAVAFSDGDQPIWQTDILLKSLQYLQKFDGLLINKPEDKWLNLFGVMNEGKNSTILGMKGMPSLSEEIIISRDLDLLDYAGGKLHFSSVSAVKSLDLIKKAKKSGLNVSCDITSFQTLFDDSALKDFDTNFKVNPPFREKKDNRAIVKALKDETIDVIVSGHNPQDEESKKLEFDLAEFGIINIQTVLPCIVKLSEDIDFYQLLEKITRKPRELLGLQIPRIEEGEQANMTLFDPSKDWTFDENSNFSKSDNSPFLGKKLKGKVLGVFNNGRFELDQELL